MIKLFYVKKGTQYRASFNTIDEGILYLTKPTINDDMTLCREKLSKITDVKYCVQNGKRYGDYIPLDDVKIEKTRQEYLSSEELKSHLYELNLIRESEELEKRRLIGLAYIEMKQQEERERLERARDRRSDEDYHHAW